MTVLSESVEEEDSQVCLFLECSMSLEILIKMGILSLLLSVN